MIENNVVQLGLWQAISSIENIQTCVGCTIQKVEKCGENWQILLANGTTYQALLSLLQMGRIHSYAKLLILGRVVGNIVKAVCLLPSILNLNNKMSPGNNFSLLDQEPFYHY